MKPKYVIKDSEDNKLCFFINLAGVESFVLLNKKEDDDWYCVDLETKETFDVNFFKYSAINVGSVKNQEQELLENQEKEVNSADQAKSVVVREVFYGEADETSIESYGRIKHEKESNGLNRITFYDSLGMQKFVYVAENFKIVSGILDIFETHFLITYLKKYLPDIAPVSNNFVFFVKEELSE